LCKPGILRLLLITTVCSMLVAARGFPDLWILVWTLVGMTLVSASANAMNMVYDEDIDGIMHRTMHRPLPSGRVEARGALVFASVIGIVGVLILHFLVNWVASLVALSGHLFYVFIYTMWLKRSTPHNIVIGGAAGAVPPLVGWAAVTGDLSLAAWIMFAIIFFWTPPHFWALALYKRLDYSRARVPMLPVVRGERATKKQIVLYAVLLIPVSLALAFAGMGIIYLVAASVLGLAFCAFSIKTATEAEGTYRWAKLTFAFSILYLGLLFGAMSLDSLLVEPLFAAQPIAPAPIEFVPVEPGVSR
jgi:protoheme IX farnesyltransferase